MIKLICYLIMGAKKYAAFVSGLDTRSKTDRKNAAPEWVRTTEFKNRWILSP